MKQDVADLLKNALELPAEGRASLASSLLESLDDRVDRAIADHWKLEIAARIADLDSGKVTAVSWAETRRQVSAILNGRPRREIHSEALQEFKVAIAWYRDRSEKAAREFRSRGRPGRGTAARLTSKMANLRFCSSAVCVATVSLRPYLAKFFMIRRLTTAHEKSESRNYRLTSIL
jgi:putative addiction module component (TIGR02574 family)